MFVIWIRGAIIFYLSKTDTFHLSLYILISVRMSAVTDWEICVFKPQTVLMNKFDDLLHESMK